MNRQPKTLEQALRLMREATWPEKRWQRVDRLLAVLLEAFQAGDEDRLAGAEEDLIMLSGPRRVVRKANLPPEERPISDGTGDLVDKVVHTLGLNEPPEGDDHDGAAS